MPVWSRPLVVVAIVWILAPPVSSQTLHTAPVQSGSWIGFGAAMALTEDELFATRVGQSFLVPMPATRAGAVHVFRRDAGGGWIERGTLRSTELEVGDGFGQAIVVAGDVMVVGAPGRNGGTGAVHVFERSGSWWRETAVLLAPDGAVSDSLGVSVALFDDIVTAGAPAHDGSRGAAYVFRRSAGGAWDFADKLVPATGAPRDRLGVAMIATEDRLIVGAPGRADGQGAVASFRYDVGTALWVEEGIIRPDEPIRQSAFGSALAAAGSDIVVGAPGANAGRGVAYRFRSEPAGWVESTRWTPGDSAEPQTLFGFSLAAHDDALWIGAPGADGARGAVHRYRRDGDRWLLDDTFVEDELVGAAFFGGSMVMREGVAAVGAWGADFAAGTSFLYGRVHPDSAWRALTALEDVSPLMTPVVGGQRDCEDGRAAAFSCEGVDLVAFLPVQSLGGGRGALVNDLWGWTDPLTGREYAIVGRFDGTAFVDVTEPSHPAYLGNLPIPDGSIPNFWRDVKVYNDHAFIVADAAGAHGVQIFDLTQLRDVTAPPATFRPTAHYDGIFSAHNIVINEGTGFAYTVGNSGGGETCGGGLHMIDIREPTQPTFAGCFADPSTGRVGTGYSHDAQCVVYDGPDREHHGKEVCFGANETALSVADVSDKNKPLSLGTGSYPNVGYAHQGWLTDDHRYFFMNDELDEIAGGTVRTRTLVWDVQDLDDPILVTEHLGTNEASDHNLYIRGNLMYQSNYVSGLRILDISDPENPREVAFFDTVSAGDDTAGFAGSWSNYPFFESGIIVVTSLQEGLFVLKKRDQTLIP